MYSTIKKLNTLSTEKKNQMKKLWEYSRGKGLDRQKSKELLVMTHHVNKESISIREHPSSPRLTSADNSAGIGRF